jgi:hypothetical protein
VLVAIRAWVQHHWVECLEMTVNVVESGEGDTTDACVRSVFGLPSMKIERRVVCKVQGAFVTYYRSVVFNFLMEWLCHNALSSDWSVIKAQGPVGGAVEIGSI